MTEKLTNDLQVLRDGVEKALKLATNTPQMPERLKGDKDGKEHRAAMEAYHVNMADHIKAGEKLMKEDGPKLAMAAFNVLASVIMNLDRIADAQQQIAFPKTPEPRK